MTVQISDHPKHQNQLFAQGSATVLKILTIFFMSPCTFFYLKAAFVLQEGNFTTKFDAKWIVTFEDMVENLTLRKAQVCDSRAPEKFNQSPDGNASVNSSCAHTPPGQLWGICTHCQSWGLGVSLPKGYPWAFNIHAVSDSKSKHRRFYRKRPVVCH